MRSRLHLISTIVLALVVNPINAGAGYETTAPPSQDKIDQPYNIPQQPDGGECTTCSETTKQPSSEDSTTPDLGTGPNDYNPSVNGATPDLGTGPIDQIPSNFSTTPDQGTEYSEPIPSVNGTTPDLGTGPLNEECSPGDPDCECEDESPGGNQVEVPVQYTPPKYDQLEGECNGDDCEYVDCDDTPDYPTSPAPVETPQPSSPVYDDVPKVDPPSPGGNSQSTVPSYSVDEPTPNGNPLPSDPSYSVDVPAPGENSLPSDPSYGVDVPTPNGNSDSIVPSYEVDVPRATPPTPEGTPGGSNEPFTGIQVPQPTICEPVTKTVTVTQTITVTEPGPSQVPAPVPTGSTGNDSPPEVPGGEVVPTPACENCDTPAPSPVYSDPGTPVQNSVYDVPSSPTYDPIPSDNPGTESPGNTTQPPIEEEDCEPEEGTTVPPVVTPSPGDYTQTPIPGDHELEGGVTESPVVPPPSGEEPSSKLSVTPEVPAPTQPEVYTPGSNQEIAPPVDTPSAGDTIVPETPAGADLIIPSNSLPLTEPTPVSAEDCDCNKENTTTPSEAPLPAPGADTYSQTPTEIPDTKY